MTPSTRYELYEYQKLADMKSVEKISLKLQWNFLVRRTKLRLKLKNDRMRPKILPNFSIFAHSLKNTKKLQ